MYVNPFGLGSDVGLEQLVYLSLWRQSSTV